MQCRRPRFKGASITTLASDGSCIKSTQEDDLVAPAAVFATYMYNAKKPIEVAVVDWAMFFAAFAPMFGIAAIKWEGHALKFVLAGMFVIAIVPFAAILNAASRQQAATYTVRSTEGRGDVNAGFLATYLLPFLTTDTPSRDALVAYAIFVWILGLIFTRSRTVNTSPLLYMIGYDVATVVTDRGTFVLIAKVLPEDGEVIRACRLLSGNILLEKKQT